MSLEMYKNGGSTGLYRSEDDNLITVIEGFEVDYNSTFDYVASEADYAISSGHFDSEPDVLQEFLLPLEFLDIEYEEYEPNETY